MPWGDGKDDTANKMPADRIDIYLTRSFQIIPIFHQFVDRKKPSFMAMVWLWWLGLNDRLLGFFIEDMRFF